VEKPARFLRNMPGGVAAAFRFALAPSHDRDGKPVPTFPHHALWKKK
jgi:hypothetical protein